MKQQYRLLNNIFGWLAFAVAAFTYFSTVEPTTSFWDCPEFITCAAKGEVGHPPGNTFFNLTGSFFVNFAGGDMTQAAVWVNRMSAFFSAMTILFLFWTITALTKKLVSPDEEKMTLTQMITILGSGLVGSLLYTFTDTFWFSAVEGEVYAFSSMMTALVFWLILKWEAHSDKPDSDRYIILLSYIIGLSIGVHLLNLLCIPAMVLVYYFKKKPNARLGGTLGVLALSMVIVALILYGLIPGFVKLASATELLFVNTLGCSFNTGTLVYFFFILAVLIVGLYVMYKKSDRDRWVRIALAAGVILSGVPFVGEGWTMGIIVSLIFVAIIFFYKSLNVRLAGNILYSLLVLLIGYSTFAQIIIRSSAQLPMDQNSPDEIFSFTKYLNREQYGDRPLFYGQTFGSDVVRDAQGRAVTEEGAPLYGKVVKKDPSEPDRYEVYGHKEKYQYNYNMIFPRMYSKQPNHMAGYREWADFKGQKVRVRDGREIKTLTVPTFAENMRFFFRYQLNFMYWRYFMWNFSGRQSDVQSYGEIDRGNWITGIPFIDEALVGNQDSMPSSIADNKGHNAYYMLPLILGLIGLFWQAFAGQKGIQGFWVVFFLFFMTGIAIVIYLNQTPYQPRERDYAYAGSFYAFSIWIGMGVAALCSALHSLIKRENAAVATLVTLACLCVPMQMAAENWDDHDRSGRYTARDFGRNYLTSVEKDAIIFTNGDNDTFPLWYAQDVEGYRTDVRVCNLSYLQTDWYITQMKRPAYDSPALPISLRPDQYNQNKLDFAYVISLANEMPITSAMEYLTSDDPKYHRLPNYGEDLTYLPTSKLVIPIDSAAVANSPVISLADDDKILDRMVIDLGGKSYVTKNEIAILSMLQGIAADGWKRPIYFATTVGSEMYMSLNNYFRLAGLAYQIVPLAGGGTHNADVDKLYDNMMNKFVWGNIDDPKVYLDENNRRMCRTQRLMFSTLINQLLDAGDKERAAKAAEFCVKQIPSYNVPNDHASLTMVQALYMGNKTEMANEIVLDLIRQADEYALWANKLSSQQIATIGDPLCEQIFTMRDAISVAKRHGQGALVEAYEPTLSQYFNEKKFQTPLNNYIKRLQRR